MKGRFVAYNDSIVVVEENKVSVDQISSIGTISSFRHIMGKSLIAIGPGLIAFELIMYPLVGSILGYGIIPGSALIVMGLAVKNIIIPARSVAGWEFRVIVTTSSGI